MAFSAEREIERARPAGPADDVVVARPHRFRRRSLRVVGAILVLPVAFLLLSFVGALRTPGNEDLQAKWADWLRDHHAGWAVNRMEATYFSHHAPPVGGKPVSLDPVAPPVSQAPRSHGPSHRTPVTAPAPVRLLVRGLPGEGHWAATGPLVNGRPSMYVAETRPDTVHTSVLTSVVRVDPSALRLRLIPGAREPGGQWTTPPEIGPTIRPSIIAAFNGGFRFKDAHGGFYADGRAGVPLVNGAASIVISRTGAVGLGQWGRDVRMRSDTESVLQNLVLLVDHGQPVPGIDAGDHRKWGDTLGNQVLVWRSGLGITRSGQLLFVAGPGLSAKTLADVLVRAGAVRAMTLDINPTWVTFNFFDHPDARNRALVVPRKLIPSMHRPADRYLSKESRDFFTVSTS